MNRFIKTVLMVPASAGMILALGSIKPTLEFVFASDYISEIIEFLPPDLADRRRPAGRSRGGASRGNCSVINKDLFLTALVPAMTETHAESVHPTSELVWNLTTQERPSFWFYVPYELSGRITLEFVLEDQNGMPIYQGQVVPMSHNSGVLKVSLPDTAPALVKGEAYHWVLKARCDGRVSVFVDGWIERAVVSDAFQLQLDPLSLREQAALYATNGIWQDALTIVGDLYGENSLDDNLREDWINLLTSAGLGDVAEELILGNFELNSTLQEPE